MAEQGSGGNVIVAIASFFRPGLGQLVQGRLLPAVLFFAFTALFYGLMVTWPLGAIIHLISIISAARFSS